MTTPSERLARIERQLERLRSAPSGTGGGGGGGGDLTLAANSGLEFVTGALRVGLEGGLYAINGQLGLGDPLAVSADSESIIVGGDRTNPSLNGHTHPVTAFSDGLFNPGQLLKSDPNGDLYLRRAIADDLMYTPRVEAGVGDLNLVANTDVVITSGHWTMFADNRDMRSQSHTPGFLGQGWRISWPETDKPHLDIRSIYAERLEVSAFQADIMRVRIAEDFLTQGMAFTAEDFVTPGSTVDPNNTIRVMFESNPVLGDGYLFLPDEWVMFNIIQRGIGLVVAQIWGQVSLGQIEAPDEFGVGQQSWLFTLRNGNTNFTIPKSSIVLAFGTSSAKNGYIHHNVLSTAYGPWTRYATWTGSDPFTVANRKYHVQVGNLHGLVDIDSDRYGIAAGDNLAKTPDDPTNPFKGFTADNSAGMRLFNTDISAYVGAVQKMYIAASGSEMWLGTSPSDKRFNYLDGDLTIVGVLEAAGHQFRADEDGVKISVSPGAAFEGLSESVQWLYNSLDTGTRTWIGTRVYGTADANSQLSLVAIGADSGAWGTVAMRAREYGQDPLLDTSGTTFMVTPINVFVGPQSGIRISSDPADLETPVPGGQLYAETIITEDLTVTGVLSGESLTGAAWDYPGDVMINAHAATDTVVTIINLSAGRADLSVDRDILVGGSVDGVDVSAFKSDFDVHTASANAHHAQVHGLDSTDHTGTLSWDKINRTTSGLTAGHVLRASGATAFAFAELQHGDLGGISADQHHAQVHDIIGTDHTLTASQYQVVGATAANVLGLLTSSATPTANTLAMTDANARLTLTNLTTTNAILANGGVDYGGDTLAENVNYLLLSGSKPLYSSVQLQGEFWYLATDGTLSSPAITAPGELIIVPQASVIFGPGDSHAYTAEGVWLTSADYMSETTGWGLSPTGVADVRALLANEIIAKSFIVDLEQAIAGAEIVTKSVTKLSLPYGVPYATTTPIVFRGKATATTLTATLTIAKPVGTVENDFMLAHIITASSVSAVSWPPYWYPIQTVNSGGGTLHLFVYTATASEGTSYAWGFTGAGEIIGTIQSFGGVDPGDPVFAYTVQSGNGGNVIVPGIDAQMNGMGMAFVAGLYDTSNAGLSGTPTGNYVEREDARGAAHTWLAAADTVQVGLGFVSNPLYAINVAHPWAAALFCLKPATWNTTRITVDDLPSATGMAVFESGDIVRLRLFSRAGGGLNITDCWGAVSNFTSNGNGTQSWNFARSAAPNAGLIGVGSVIEAGALVLDYGKDGDGFYEINAYSGTYASTAPYAQVVKWTGHPATGQVVRTREGNLEGITQQADEYGLWAGAKGASPLGVADQYIRVSNLGVLINNVPIKLYNGSSVQTIQLNSDGTAWFKDGAGNVKLNWDGSNLTIVGSITVVGGNAATTGDLAGKINVGGAAGDINANVTTIDGGKITTGSVTALQIAANTITATQIAASTITATQIAANTITANKIAANTITSAQLNFVPVTSTNVVASINATAEGIRISGSRINIDGSVTFSAGYDPTGKIAAGGAAADVNAGVTTISGGKITSFSITATQIAASTITAAQIAANTITGEKINLTSYLAINSATWGTQGIQLQYNSGAPRFYAGNGSSSYIRYEAGSVYISGGITASSGGISGSFYVGSGVGAGGYLYVGSGADIRMGFDGIKMVLPNTNSVTLPTNSSALRWFANTAVAFSTDQNYVGVMGYHHYGLSVVDAIQTAFVGSGEYGSYTARNILQAGNFDGATYRSAEIQVIKNPGANTLGVIRCIATYTKVEGMLTLKEQAPPATPVHEGCIYFTPSGKMVFAHYDGSSTFFKWLDMTQTSTAWQHSTSAPA